MTDTNAALPESEAYIPRESKPEHAYPDGPRGVMGLYSWFKYGYIAFLALSSLLGILSLIMVVSPDLFSAMVDEFSYEFTPLDIVMSFASLAYIATFLFCVVMTCRVTYRTMRNLHTVGSQQVSNSPTMSVVYYFIPLANLVMPAQITSDIYRGTMKATDGVIKDGRVSLWWACWLISGVADRVSYAFGYGVESAAIGLISLVLSMVAAYTLMRLLRDISKAQEDLKHGGVASVFD